MKTKFTCSFPYTSSNISSSTSAACSFVTASASLLASQASADVGLDQPEDGEGETFPLVPAADFSVFSIAFAAATFALSSAEVSLAAEGAGVGTPMDITFGFCAVAPGVSPPIESVLTTDGPED